MVDFGQEKKLATNGNGSVADPSGASGALMVIDSGGGRMTPGPATLWQGPPSTWLASTAGKGGRYCRLREHRPEAALPESGVMVSQGQPAPGPELQLEHFALGMVILALRMIALLCVYYCLHRSQRFSI